MFPANTWKTLFNRSISFTVSLPSQFVRKVKSVYVIEVFSLKTYVPLLFRKFTQIWLQQRNPTQHYITSRYFIYGIHWYNMPGAIIWRTGMCPKLGSHFMKKNPWLRCIILVKFPSMRLGNIFYEKIPRFVTKCFGWYPLNGKFPISRTCKWRYLSMMFGYWPEMKRRYIIKT